MQREDRDRKIILPTFFLLEKQKDPTKVWVAGPGTTPAGWRCRGLRKGIIRRCSGDEFLCFMKSSAHSRLTTIESNSRLPLRFIGAACCHNVAPSLRILFKDCNSPSYLTIASLLYDSSHPEQPRPSRVSLLYPPPNTTSIAGKEGRASPWSSSSPSRNLPS